jgi:hypothetical protein
LSEWEVLSTSILARRFGELAEQMAAVEATKRYDRSEYFSGDRVDDEKFLNWKVKAKSLLNNSCGKESEHYSAFIEAEKPQSYVTNWESFKNLKAIFLAAREDFEGGYLRSIRSLVQAEVFSTELDQARELLAAGYKTPAAVVAGVVLETGLRRMCQDRSLELGKLDRMNAALSKDGAYNLLVQKRITALADIRNNAAHGHPDQFNEKDVGDMISYVENFLAEHLS